MDTDQPEQGDWFTESFPAVESTPAVDEAATQAAAPEVETTPDQMIAESPVTESVAEPEAEPEPTGPAPIDWNHPELQPVLQTAQQHQQLRAQLQQLQQQRQATAFQARLAEMADGDPERLQQLNGMLAQVATPLVQQTQETDRQAQAIAKSFSAFYIAAQAQLTEEQLKALHEETDALMGVEGTEVMQRTAFGKRDFLRTHQTQLTERDARIAELELQVASQGQLAQREAAGADLVDGGQGGIAGDLSIDDQLRAAPDMDAYFAVLSRSGRAA